MQPHRPKSKGVSIGYLQTELILHTGYIIYNSIIENPKANLKPQIQCTHKFVFFFWLFNFSFLGTTI